ncbi:MAG: HPr-rel-A system PqqD family peptide chaperone [Sphingomonadales bacterium]
MDGSNDAYRLAAPIGTLDWREWDDGCVVFNRATGETHYLDTFTSYLLCLVEAGVCTQEALAATVCGELGRERTRSLEAQIVRALDNFAALALLERAR